jgi:hypothetical protein
MFWFNLRTTYFAHFQRMLWIKYSLYLCGTCTHTMNTARATHDVSQLWALHMMTVLCTAVLHLHIIL